MAMLFFTASETRNNLVQQFADEEYVPICWNDGSYPNRNVEFIRNEFFSYKHDAKRLYTQTQSQCGWRYTILSLSNSWVCMTLKYFIDSKVTSQYEFSSYELLTKKTSISDKKTQLLNLQKLFIYPCLKTSSSYFFFAYVSERFFR